MFYGRWITPDSLSPLPGVKPGTVVTVGTVVPEPSEVGFEKEELAPEEVSSSVVVVGFWNGDVVVALVSSDGFVLGVFSYLIALSTLARVLPAALVRSAILVVVVFLFVVVVAFVVVVVVAFVVVVLLAGVLLVVDPSGSSVCVCVSVTVGSFSIVFEQEIKSTARRSASSKIGISRFMESIPQFLKITGVS